MRSRATSEAPSRSTTEIRRPRRQRADTPWALFLALFSLTLTAAFSACSSVPERFPPGGQGGEDGIHTVGVVTGPCEDGATRSCSKKLGVQGTVISCYVGVQECEGGAWGECKEGIVQPKLLPPSWGVLIDAGSCKDNPCDPTCQGYDMDAGLDVAWSQDATSPDATVVDWQGGDLSTLAQAPGGLVKKGLLQSCTSAYDCQFDFECTNPAYVNCAHSKCAAGANLTIGCDPPASTGPMGCVAEICAAAKDPACCVAASSTTGCSKAPCVAQTTKPTGCPTAVQTAINGVVTWKAACGTAWTQDCVDKFRQTSGVGCGWDAQCVTEVGTICQVDCGLDDGSGVCVQRLPGERSPSCKGVDLTLGIPCDDVIPICNHGQSDLASQKIRLWLYPANSAKMPAGNPSGSPAPTECVVTKSIPAGKCVGVTSAECAFNGANKEIIVNPQGALTNPVPIVECTTNDNWTLFNKGTACGEPVCASGAISMTAAPVTLFISLDRSSSMNSGSPLKIDTARNALVNFFGASGSAGMKIAFRFFPDDTSTTANDCRDDSGSACTGTLGTCGTPHYGASGTVTLPSATAVLPVTLPSPGLVSYVTTNAVAAKLTSAGTPTCRALQGAEDWAVKYKTANPKETVAVVFVTDGDPNENCSCTEGAAASNKTFLWTTGNATGTNSTDAAQLVMTPLTKGVHTYAIGQDATSGGISTAGKKLLNAVAAAGGTSSAIILGPTTTAAQFTAQMDAIRKKEASCDMVISACRAATAACTAPADCCSGVCTSGACVGGKSSFDPTDASLVYLPTSGNALVWDAPGCDGTGKGWTYDNPAAPSRVSLCPTTCATVQADTAPMLQLVLRCAPPPPVPGVVTTQVFQATCPANTKPQWAYFAYDVSTPGDSSIEFLGDSADDQSAFCSISTMADVTGCASLSPLAKPSAQGGAAACTLDGQCSSGLCQTSVGKCADPPVCTMGSSFPGCPVNVFAKTGSIFAGTTGYFQLVMKRNPTSDGKTLPQVNSIQLTYSCPPAA